MAITVAGVLAAGVVTQAVSGIAQYFQQRNAAKASSKELDKIREAFDAIVPPELDLDVADPPELIAAKTPTVNYDFSKLTPEKYKVVAEFAPEITPYIAEQRPDLVKDTQVGLEGREAQMAALRKFQDIGEGGFDPQFDQRMKQAAQGAQQAAQSRQESILQDYQRRGLLGSGTQLAAELAGSEGAMSRAADMSGDAATQAYLNQLDALRTSADLGGQVRGAELDLASRNAAIANAYNQRTSRAYQSYLQNAADTRNQAAAANLARKQGISDLNVKEGNIAAVRERDRTDALNERIRDQKIADIERENIISQKKFDNEIRAQGIKNDLTQQKFANEMAKAGGTADVGNMRRQDINDRAALESRTIGAVADAAQTGATGYAQYARDKKRDARQDKLDDAYLDYLKNQQLTY